MIQSASTRNAWKLERQCAGSRSAKILVLLAILLPSLFGIAGLVIDGGLMMSEYRNLQHAADAASTAAAMQLKLDKSPSDAIAVAEAVVHQGNGFADASVTVHIPPVSGNFAGLDGHVEVIVEAEYESRLMKVLNGVVDHSLRARSVAGIEDVTSEAAIVILDSDPRHLSYPNPNQVIADIDEAVLSAAALEQLGQNEGMPTMGPQAANQFEIQLGRLVPTTIAALIDQIVAKLPTLSAPALIGGLEVEGLGRLVVDGAIHINNRWGGVDENCDPVGDTPGPPYALSCMPILPTTRVRARDIRVVGGVDNPDFYRPFDANDRAPLQANRLPVKDPLENLTPPTTASAIHDPADLVVVALSPVNASQLTNTVLSLLPAPLRFLFQPLIGAINELLAEPVIEPGVYNSMTVLSPLGGARFLPGVYVIRGVSPVTQMSLCILGPVQAEGVLFYITDSPDYDPTTGLPDAAEDDDLPPTNTIETLLPSTLIVSLLPTARITGLNSPGSPLDGMLIFQRRLDRRPIIIEAQQLLGSNDISGTIYSKWAHVLFIAGAGQYDLRFVTGTMRVVTATTTTIAPTSLFPPAQDVLLLE